MQFEGDSLLRGGVCYNLHASQVLLKGSREMEITVPRTATGCGTVAGRLQSDLPTVLISRSFFGGGLSSDMKCGKFLD